ncbi:hypothetical protein BDF21DRAFT_352237 [Thamnidium elegans]|nr:hypothetical protein BDF21DRAFT_352237 [Thamnidium elegans]
MAYSDNEDIWANSSDEEQVAYERNLAEKEWERLQEDHGNTGYKEGIVEGKEVNMQRGFDKGYTEGLVIGKLIGKLREVDKIEVQNIYSVDYFRENGPKRIENYISPDDYVKQLEERVKATLEQVAAKYAC